MNNRPAVSNTTPLITLAGVGLLDLPPQLYGTVHIPRAVAAEYQAKAAASDPRLEQQPWLTIVDSVAVDPALPKLGAGEAEAISLALLLGARFILLDERKARRVARLAGLTVVGTLALLVRAKERGLIPAIKPIVESMRAQGRYFGDELIARVLSDAGE